MAITRSAAKGNHHSMPGWDDFGGYTLSGLGVCFLSLVYWIVPMTLSLLGFGGFVLSALLGTGASIKAASLAPVLGGLALGGTFALFCGAVGVVLSLIAAVVWPIVYIRYAVTGELSAAFNPALILKDLFVAPKDYLTVVLISLLIYFTFSTIVTITSGFALLLLPLVIHIWFGHSHLLGQFWRKNFSSHPDLEGL